MAYLNQAVMTQLENIEKRTGKSLDELEKIVEKSGISKFGEVRSMLKEKLGMGHGDANTLAQYVLNREKFERALSDDIPETEALDEIYTGAKADLRPIHEKLMDEINQFGEFEIAPKKTNISLRRNKQFALIGPATNSQVEVGLNIKDLAGHDRLKEQKPGSMCQYTIRLSSVDEVDSQLVSWIKVAYDSAGWPRNAKIPRLAILNH